MLFSMGLVLDALLLWLAHGVLLLRRLGGDVTSTSRRRAPALSVQHSYTIARVFYKHTSSSGLYLWSDIDIEPARNRLK